MQQWEAPTRCIVASIWSVLQSNLVQYCAIRLLKYSTQYSMTQHSSAWRHTALYHKTHFSFLQCNPWGRNGYHTDFSRPLQPSSSIILLFVTFALHLLIAPAACRASNSVMQLIWTASTNIIPCQSYWPRHMWCVRFHRYKVRILFFLRHSHSIVTWSSIIFELSSPIAVPVFQILVWVDGLRVPWRCLLLHLSTMQPRNAATQQASFRIILLHPVPSHPILSHSFHLFYYFIDTSFWSILHCFILFHWITNQHYWFSILIFTYEISNLKQFEWNSQFTGTTFLHCRMLCSLALFWSRS